MYLLFQIHVAELGICSDFQISELGDGALGIRTWFILQRGTVAHVKCVGPAPAGLRASIRQSTLSMNRQGRPITCRSHFLFCGVLVFSPCFHLILVSSCVLYFSSSPHPGSHLGIILRHVFLLIWSYYLQLLTQCRKSSLSSGFAHVVFSLCTSY